MEKNLERMIALATDFFDWKNDPGQLQVDDAVIEKLHRLHTATLNQERTADGPIAWILTIPTTLDVMERFMAGELNEQQLFDLTEPGQRFEALYLCSALVLPEYRSRGIAKRLTLAAIDTIRRDHELKALYYWAFSPEGKALAEAVAAECGLPLRLRTHAV